MTSAASTDRKRYLAWATFVLIVLLFAAGITLGFLSIDNSTANPYLDLILIAALLVFPVVGLLIVHRRPDSRIGWICLATGAAWGFLAICDTYSLYGLKTNPGSVPMPELGIVISDVAWAPAVVLMGVFLVLLFPDGKPPSPRWRIVLWVAGTATSLFVVLGLLSPTDYTYAGYPGVTNPLAIDALEAIEPVGIALIVTVPISMLASAAGVIVRYRRSRGIERLQMKWLVASCAVVAVVYATLMVTFAGIEPTEASPLAQLLQQLGLSTFGLIPIAIGIAVLKHRLYDIDVVINKTILYGGLVVFLAVVYVAIAVGVAALVGSQGENNAVMSTVGAAAVAIAFQPARERARRVAARLVYGSRAEPYEVLAAFAEDVGGTYAIDDVLPRMARILGEGTGATSATVWLRRDGGFAAAAQWPDGSTSPAAIPSFDGDPGDTRRAVEVVHQQATLGALSIEKSPADPVKAAEERLLQHLASQAGLVLNNVGLHREVEQRVEDLEAARIEILEKLALAGEFRDDDTHEHTDRVAHMCGEVAAELGLPKDEVEVVTRAAMLHDIGKIGVSDTILLKPGRLTDEEFAAMKTHTTIGGSILANSAAPVLQVGEQIALCHHERWDGSGYPRGLAGEEIPFPARILSVVDVYDALTNERPYKAAWPIEEAVAEIRRCGGTQFDPTVVAAFLSVLTRLGLWRETTAAQEGTAVASGE